MDVEELQQESKELLAITLNVTDNQSQNHQKPLTTVL